MDFDRVFTGYLSDKIQSVAGPLGHQIGTVGIANDDNRIELRVDPPSRTLDNVSLALSRFETIKIDSPGRNHGIAYRRDTQWHCIDQGGVAWFLGYLSEFAHGEYSC